MLREGVSPPPYSSVPGVQRNRGGQRHIFKTGTRQGNAGNVGGRRGAEGLSAVWLLTAPAGLGPGLHPLSPSWADTNGQEERQSRVSLYEPSSCQATLLHDCREPESEGLVSSLGSAHRLHFSLSASSLSCWVI